MLHRRRGFAAGVLRLTSGWMPREWLTRDRKVLRNVLQPAAERRESVE
jgi:hypothetical protein